MFQPAGLSRRSKVNKWAVGGIAMLGLVLGGYWYFNHGAGPAARGPRAGAAPVRVAKVTRHDMPVIERTIGNVVAFETVDVTPQVQGRVQQVFFKEGQMVKKGDLLFQIDPRPFEAALAQVRGQLAKDQAALDGARRDLKRFQSLLAENAESQQVVDDQLATVSADEGNVEADKANVQTAALNVEYTDIRSPVDGKTGPINIMPGNVISVTGTTSTVNPLVVVSQIRPIKISLPAPDRSAAHPGTPEGRRSGRHHRSERYGRTHLHRAVDFISNAVNATTGTIELRATYPNTEAALAGPAGECRCPAQ